MAPSISIKLSVLYIIHHDKLDTFLNSSLIKNYYRRYKNQVGLFVKDNSVDSLITLYFFNTPIVLKLITIDFKK